MTDAAQAVRSPLAVEEERLGYAITSFCEAMLLPERVKAASGAYTDLHGRKCEIAKAV